MLVFTQFKEIIEPLGDALAPPSAAPASRCSGDTAVGSARTS